MGPRDAYFLCDSCACFLKTLPYGAFFADESSEFIHLQVGVKNHPKFPKGHPRLFRSRLSLIIAQPIMLALSGEHPVTENILSLKTPPRRHREYDITCMSKNGKGSVLGSSPFFLFPALGEGVRRCITFFCTFHYLHHEFKGQCGSG